MSDDHARAAKIDQLQSELGWAKGLLAQAVRDRKAAQTLLNMERERADKAEKKGQDLCCELGNAMMERDQSFQDFARLEADRDELRSELALLRVVAGAAGMIERHMVFWALDPNTEVGKDRIMLSHALASWRDHAPKP